MNIQTSTNSIDWALHKHRSTLTDGLREAPPNDRPREKADRLISGCSYIVPRREGSRSSVDRYYGVSLCTYIWRTRASGLWSANIILIQRQEISHALPLGSHRVETASCAHQACRESVRLPGARTATAPPQHACKPSLGLRILHDSLDHLVTHAHSVLQTWCEVALNIFETVAICFEGTEGHTIRPCLRV